jgi:uncharacterized membrane protein YccF (DUF307 family)
MSFLGNILWIFLGGGIFIALFYFIGGIVLCATIVGIPFGVECFKLAWVGLVPFGKEIDTGGSARGLLPIVMNILWLVFGGLEVALTHLVFALLMAITIIGLPFAAQHLKLLRLALVPFGARIRG